MTAPKRAMVSVEGGTSRVVADIIEFLGGSGETARIEYQNADGKRVREIVPSNAIGAAVPAQPGVMNLCNADVHLVARACDAHAAVVERLGADGKVEARKLRDIAERYRQLADASTDER
jgi:hypothetical protein